MLVFKSEILIDRSKRFCVDKNGMLANGKKLTNMILSNDVEKNSKVRYFLAMKILIVILPNVQYDSQCEFHTV